MLAIILVAVGILLRFAPHPANFTPVAAIAIFGGAYLNKKYAILIPLVLMVVSDSLIGTHNVMLFTWGGFILSAFLGFWVKKRKSALRVFSAGLASSVIFYLVSNFGVWIMGWYPLTLSGLANCYIMGLPFLRDFTLSTILYAAAFFGIYEFVARLARNTKLAKVLLEN